MVKTNNNKTKSLLLLYKYNNEKAKKQRVILKIWMEIFIIKLS